MELNFTTDHIFALPINSHVVVDRRAYTPMGMGACPVSHMYFIVFLAVINEQNHNWRCDIILTITIDTSHIKRHSVIYGFIGFEQL